MIIFKEKIMNNLGNTTVNSGLSTLLVLHHRENSVGIVQQVGKDGSLLEVRPDQAGFDALLRIDSSEESFLLWKTILTTEHL